MHWKIKHFVFRFFVWLSNFLFGKDITHRSKIFKRLNELRVLLLEKISPARRRQAKFIKLNPEAPWFCPQAIIYLEKELKSNFNGFEWGCGRSTLWFAKRVEHITSVEGRKSWYEEIKKRIITEKFEDKIDLILSEVTTEYNFLKDEVEAYSLTITKYPDDTFDFVVVDGHFRDACISAIGRKLKEGGYLIIDNSEIVSDTILASIGNYYSKAWDNGIWQTTVLKYKR